MENEKNSSEGTTLTSPGYKSVFVGYLGVAATAVLIVSVFGGVWNVFSVQLEEVHAAESIVVHAEDIWQKGLAEEDPISLRTALDSFEAALNLGPFTLSVSEDGIRGHEAGFIAGVLAGAVRPFMRWLARPLKLQCMHRIAAVRELLRVNASLIAEAHGALLAEDYCQEFIFDPSNGNSDRPRQLQYESCVAPLARGTILFASSSDEAEAAFKAATQLQGPDGAALTWTTRWQLPDHHTPALRTQPWWPLKEVVDTLEAAFPSLLAEFQRVFAKVGTEGFKRRRADAWIAKPREGWGMLPIVAGTDKDQQCIVKHACDIVSTVRNELDGKNGTFSGVGYYRLQAGTRLQPHSGPTNERLTCHLTLQGEGASFRVGEETRVWHPGRAFCFDDSFVHEAVHEGAEDRYVLLLDVPHPDLQIPSSDRTLR